MAKKTYLVLFAAALALVSRAQATPLTHFTPNATGGFDAFIYPELLNGTPSLQGGIFTLPQAVNPGYVVILANATSRSNDTTSWVAVIRFFANGGGPVDDIQLLTGSPTQSSYFPSLVTVKSNPNAFIVKGSSTYAAEGVGGFTTFTDYSVVTQVTRNYHFFNGPLPSVPDDGSTLILLGAALGALIVFRTRRQRI